MIIEDFNKKIKELIRKEKTKLIIILILFLIIILIILIQRNMKDLMSKKVDYIKLPQYNEDYYDEEKKNIFEIFKTSYHEKNTSK